MNGWFAWFIIAVVLILVFIPPKWDPAIRLKEWLERKKHDRDN